MTQEPKETIAEIKWDGLGVRRIARNLGISVNTVKSFLRHHPEALVSDKLCNDFSHYCRKPFYISYYMHTPNANKRKLCSDKCRYLWWKAHQDHINRKALYPKISSVVERD